MKILITGSQGQLGQSIEKISENYSHEFVFTDKEELDITNEEDVNQFIKENKFDCLINCAAYTAVDKAEDDFDNAYALNVIAPYILAKCTKKYDVKFIHISTDYVFDGKNCTPYTIYQLPNPKNTYGQTKYQGEKKVLRANKNAIIIRTSWLYSEFNENFVKTMLKLGAVKKQINVVYDQIGTPTYATDLANCIMKIVERKPNNNIVHFSNEGVCSWYDFAKKIMQIKQFKCEVNPILSKEYPTRAKRPFYSVLDKTDIKNDLSITIPHWEDSLRICLNVLEEL